MLRADLERRFKWRQALTAFLVFLTSVSVVSTAVAVWAHSVVFDTDRFIATIESVFEDADLYILIADEATESVLQTLAIEDRLTQRLGDLDTFISEGLLDALGVDQAGRERLQRLDRPSLADLAPAITTALEERIGTGMQAFFESREFRSRAPELVRRGHEVTVALVRGELVELPNVYIEDDEVRLNLVNFIGEALRGIASDIRTVVPEFELPDVVSDRVQEGRAQLEIALQARLPEDFGQVTIISAASLSEAQDAAAQLDRFVWAAVVLSLGLLAATIGVSPNRRRTAIHLGIGISVGAAISGGLIRQLDDAIVDAIADPRSSALAGGIVGNVLSGLHVLELVIGVTAILVAVVAHLAGRPAWFVRWIAVVDEWTDSSAGSSLLDRWLARHTGVLQAVGLLIAATAIFLIGLDLLSIIVIGLLLGAYLWAVAEASRRVARDRGEERVQVFDAPDDV